MPTCSMSWMVMRSTVTTQPAPLQHLSVADRLVATRRHWSEETRDELLDAIAVS